MEEPLTQNSTVLKCSLAVHIYSTPDNKQLEHQHSASFQPSQLLSMPAMKRRAGGSDLMLLCIVRLHWLMFIASSAT